MTVTLTVRVSDSAGNETVATHNFETGGTTPLVGDVSGTFGDCFVAGDLNLTGDLFIEGLMTGVDSFRIQGNGHSVFFQNGGRVDLHGQVKARWGPWGTDSTGWEVGDRIAVAPTAIGVYTPSELVWVGGWASLPRPSNSPDVTQINGSIAKPEVANLSQSIVIENLSRGFHFHDSAGIQNMSDVKFLNCGTVGVLGNYPIHLHLLGDNSRGSIFERVVVEGGKNHAFVPHASHGITLRDTVAYKTQSSVYWWDDGDATHDLTFDHCLALGATKDATNHVTGFNLAAGTGSLVDCAAAGIVGGVQASSGFQWPSFVGNWASNNLVAHNNNQTGIYVWNNGGGARSGTNWFTFRNTRFGVVFGAYQNPWVMSGVVASENFRGNDANADVELHAVPFANTPQPRLINSRVARVLQGHHNVQTAANGLLPTLLIEVELDSFKVADDVGMWVDFIRCIKNGVDLEPGDIEIISADVSCRWRGQRRDGTAWQKLPDGTVTAIPPFWVS